MSENDRQELDGATQQRSRTWMVFWTAVAALATAAGAVAGFLELQDKEPPKSDRKAADKRGLGPSALPKGKFLLRNDDSGNCADVPGLHEGRPNGPILEFTCESNGDNQLWRLDEAENIRGPQGQHLFLIVNAVDGLCIDLPGRDGQKARTPVEEDHCEKTTRDNQLWWIEKQEGGHWIRNVASKNLCLDMNEKDAALDDHATIYACLENDDQVWEMVKS